MKDQERIADRLENIHAIRSYYQSIIIDYDRLHDNAMEKLSKAQKSLLELQDFRACAEHKIVECDKQERQLRNERKKIVLAPKLARIEKLRKQLAKLEAAE